MFLMDPLALFLPSEQALEQRAGRAPCTWPCVVHTGPRAHGPSSTSQTCCFFFCFHPHAIFLSTCIHAFLSYIGPETVGYALRKHAKAGDETMVGRQPSEGVGEGSNATRARRVASKRPVVE